MRSAAQVRELLGEWPEATLPVALLPVRLETRFIQRGIDEVEFRLRIYPDDIHIDTFEPELTPDELSLGQRYWTRRWEAKDDEDQQRVAWQALVDRFDAPRAAWIARATTPTNLHRLGRGQPAFSSPPLHDEAWTRPPLARLLPDRFVALGYLESELVLREVGAPIPRNLTVGPTPDAPPPADLEPYADEQDFLVMDEGMRWLTDFDLAEKLGMAMRVTMDSHAADHGFDELVVVGIVSSSDADATAVEVERLVDAQHYTEGIAIVPRGTPTNNTAEARAGFSSLDPGHAASFATETGPPLLQAGDGSSGDRLARALGIAASVFGHVAHADGRDSDHARHMQRALWYASWGTYLREILDTPFGRSALPDAQRHFVEFVRGAGPLPTIRVGRQPYGVLPVLSTAHWTPMTGRSIDRHVLPVLQKVRAHWRTVLDKVPRVGRQSDPDDAREDLLHALAMQSESSEIVARPLLNRALFGMVGTPGFAPQFPPVGVEQRWATFAAREREFGLLSLSRLGELMVTFEEFPIARNLVQDELGAARLDPNYIEWLRTAAYGEIEAEIFSSLTSGTFAADKLLYLVLRHATLLEYAYAAGLILANDGQIDPVEVAEPSFYDADPAEPTRPTLGRLLDRPSSRFDNRPLREVIHTVTGDVHPEGAELDDYRASLAHLAGLAPVQLDRLLRDGFDVSSYRLDAWFTSFATERLARNREKFPKGVHAGAYGWVENVRWNKTREPAEPPDGEAGGPLFVNASNAGYVPAPSMLHAATAAVMRSGYLSQPDAGNPLAVDLSSRRVRLAHALLDGVRQGQPLSALLGYRFERELQERRLAQYIEPFRKIAPLGELRRAQAEWQGFEAEAERLRGTSLFDLLAKAEANAAAAKERFEALLERHRQRFLFPPGTQLEAMEATTEFNVVDGLALSRLFKAGGIPFGEQGLPPEGTSDHSGIVVTLRELDDAVDAVGDAVTAESVFHTVRGNPIKVGATLAAVSTGETPPPELEVTRTPRSGVGLEHRLLVLFSGPSLSTSGWPASATRARALAEPYINGWAVRMLGRPDRVRLLAEFVDPETDEVLTTREARLSDLDISAADCIYGTRGQRDPAATMVGRWALRHLRAQPPGGLPDDVVVRLNTQRQSGWQDADSSLAELVEVARAVYDLVTQARPLEPADLTLPDNLAPAVINVRNVEIRADNAQASMATHQTDLEALLEDVASADLGSLRATLLELSYFGIETAVPEPPRAASDQDREALLSQAGTVRREVQSRIARLDAMAAGFSPAGASPAARRDHAIARLKVVFGDDFVVLTRLMPANAAELEQGFVRSVESQDGNPTAVFTWLHRTARVRPGAARLETVLDYAQARTNSQTNRYFPPLDVCQLVHPGSDAAGDAPGRWLGLPLRDGEEPPGGQLSLVAHLPAPFRADKPVLGLVVDGWTEALPNAHQHAGIAFNFDAPGSRPPQAVLLAVPPADEMETWDFEVLEATVREAVALAKLRALDPLTLSEVPAYNHFMPALLYALNVDGDTVSTDFTRAAMFRPPPPQPG